MVHPSRHAASLELGLNTLLVGSFELHVFHSPWWLVDGNAQVTVPARLRHFPRIAYRRERRDAPDHDFTDLDRTMHKADAHAPLVVMFHGLGGGSHSHCARLLMDVLHGCRWLGVIPRFRGCSGEMNLAPYMYHCGDGAEIAWILGRLYRTVYVPQDRKLLIVGVSLGGNALLRYLGEHGTDARYVTTAATVSAPLDVRAGDAALSKGFNIVYTCMFLCMLKVRANTRLDRYPGLYDRATMMATHTLGQLDSFITAPLRGLRSVLGYWTRAPSRPVLREVYMPVLVLNARNDPLLPEQHLPGAAEVPPDVALNQPLYDGHVSFLLRHDETDHVDWTPAYILRFFDDVLVRPGQAGDAHG